MRRGVLKDPRSPSKIANYGIGLHEGIMHTGFKSQQKALETPIGTAYWGSGYRGTSIQGVLDAVRGATYIDFETRGLNEYTDPIWSASRISPGDSPLTLKDYQEKMSRTLFDPGQAGRADYAYFDDTVFGLKDMRPRRGIGAEVMTESDALKHIMRSMGDIINPSVYEGQQAVPLQQSMAFKQFVKDTPGVAQLGAEKQIRAYFDPQYNPLHRGVAEFLGGPDGTLTEAGRELLRLTGKTPSEVNLAGAVDTIKRHVWEGGGQSFNFKDWFAKTFEAAHAGSRTIVAHNLNFESMRAATNTDEIFWNHLKERHLHGWSIANERVDGMQRYRLYSTSADLANAKYRAMRTQSAEAWGDVFGEWIRHFNQETSKVKLLDSMDLGRSVFGMAQEQLGRSGAYNWRNTKNFTGTSLSAYAEAVTEYHKQIGDELPSWLQKEVHRARPDIYLTEQYVEDMVQIGHALREGKVESLSHRHKTILSHLGEVNASPDRILETKRREIINDVERFSRGEDVIIRERYIDPVTGRYTGPGKKIFMQEGDKLRSINIPYYKNARRKATGVDDIVDYHVRTMSSYHANALGKKRINEFTSYMHTTASRLKNVSHSGKAKEHQRAAREVSQLDIHNWDSFFGKEEVKRFMAKTENVAHVETAAKQMSSIRRIGYVTGGALAGAAALRAFMGTEAGQYMKEMQSRHIKYKQDQGIWEQVDVLASLGITAYAGTALAKQWGQSERMVAARKMRELMNETGRGIGRHLYPMALAGAALSAAMYSASSNVSDVVDAEPSGGHPFQVGSAIMSISALTALTYGAKYAKVDKDLGTRYYEQPRVVDRLTEMFRPSSLSNVDSKAMDDVDKLKVDAGRRLNPLASKRRHSAAFDAVVTPVQSFFKKRGFEDMGRTLAKWKAPAFILGGLTAMMGMDYLAKSEGDEVALANTQNIVPDTYTETEGLGGYGFSGPLHQAITPFGSRYDPALAAMRSLTEFEAAMRKARIWNPHASQLIADMGGEELGWTLGLLNQEAKFAGEILDAPAIVKYVHGSPFHKWMNNVQPENPVSVYMANARSTHLPEPRRTIPRGVDTMMKVPDPAPAYMDGMRMPSETSPLLPKGKKPMPALDIIGSDSGKRQMPHSFIMPQQSMDYITAAHADRQAQGFMVEQKKQAYNAFGNRMEDALDSTPKYTTGKAPRIQPVSDGRMRDTMRIVRGSNHKMSAMLTKMSGRYSGLPGPNRPRAPVAKRSSTHLTGAA